MQLPFVLQSGEVMKTAVAHLERTSRSTDDDSGKGRIVLATVKGDVHDIGKNLVDIILSNNGYEVVNLGIEQPIATILEVAEDKRADVVGMSGLLVKSTVVMKDNLEEMNTRGVAERFPVLLGGAALTRSYVENDLAEIYEGEVHYARDAFEGLKLMDTIMSAKRGEAPDVDSPEAVAAREKEAERKARHERSKRIAAQRKASKNRSWCRRAPMSRPMSRCRRRRFGGQRDKGTCIVIHSLRLDARAGYERERRHVGQKAESDHRSGEGGARPSALDDPQRCCRQPQRHLHVDRQAGQKPDIRSESVRRHPFGNYRPHAFQPPFAG